MPVLLQLMAGNKAPVDPSKGTSEVSQKMAVARSTLLRANGGFIPEPGFRQRKQYFAAKVG